MSTPLVSIIISAYNAEAYIRTTLQSVIDQTYQYIEIIVVNDGSTDNTLNIVESFKDRGVTQLTQDNKGQDAALNHGFQHARGEFIKFMDSDDIINEDMIRIQVAALNNKDRYVAYGEWSRFYNDNYQDADFTPMSYWKNMAPLDFLTAEPNGVMLQCGIMLIPRELIELAGLWDERIFLFNDTEFFTRILLKSKGVIFTPGARLYYRSGMTGSVSAGRARKFYESTFLATQLISDHMLAVEDTPRVRRLISNTYLMQRYHMFPKYPDLALQHDKEVSSIGYGTYKLEGGLFLSILRNILGWKVARSIQLWFYDIGYLRFLKKKNIHLSKK